MGENNSYDHLGVHRWMLRDTVRNEAYRAAIFRVVRPGDVVLDVGAGTGILSIFAAQAGARRVFAVERSAIAEVAKRIVRTNGFESVIEVIRQDLEDVDLPEKVDVVVSEWMGGLGVDENMFAPVVMARSRFLKPGGTMIPARVTALCAPAFVDEMDEALDYWRSKPHGVDLSDISDLTANESHMLQSDVRPADLIAEAQPLWSHDAAQISLTEVDAGYTAELRFVAERDGRVTALATWFLADMAPGVALTNAPDAKLTHWGRLLLPLDRTIDVKRGTTLEVKVQCLPAGQGKSEFEWDVRVAGELHDRHSTYRALPAS
jgi:SAM-dependent methyltransferase